MRLTIATAAPGVVSEAEARRLQELAAVEPALAERALATALAARDAIYSVFAAAAAGDEPRDSLLAPLNRVLRRAAGVPLLVPRGTGARLAWEAGREVNLDTPVCRILDSTVELLTGPDLQRVSQCAAPDCSWLFLDLTRNHSRQWCRAEGCGVRNRFRRYYVRHREDG